MNKSSVPGWATAICVIGMLSVAGLIQMHRGQGNAVTSFKFKTVAFAITPSEGSIPLSSVTFRLDPSIPVDSVSEWFYITDKLALYFVAWESDEDLTLIVDASGFTPLRLRLADYDSAHSYPVKITLVPANVGG